MLPRSNARTTRGSDVLLLASFSWPTGDWEIVQTLFETNDQFFVVHPDTDVSVNPLLSCNHEPYRFITRQGLVDIYRTYNVALWTSDKGFMELDCLGHIPTTIELEAARRMALQYNT